MEAPNPQTTCRILSGIFNQLAEDYNTEPYKAALVLKELIAFLMHPDRFNALSPYLQLTTGRTLIGLLNFMQDIEENNIREMIASMDISAE